MKLEITAMLEDFKKIKVNILTKTRILVFFYLYIFAQKNFISSLPCYILICCGNLGVDLYRD